MLFKHKMEPPPSVSAARRDEPPVPVADGAPGPPAFEPGVADVLVVKALFTKALPLPPEIVDTIVDLAEYWPHTTTAAVFPPAVVRGSTARENMFLIRAPPLGLRGWGRVRVPDSVTDIARTPLQPRLAGKELSAEELQELIAPSVAMLAHPCRRIVFTIRSHDQGWGGNIEDWNTYNGSWTWFEAGIERWCKPDDKQGQADAAGRRTREDGGAALRFDDLYTVLPEPVWNESEQAYFYRHPLHWREDAKICSNVTVKRQTTTHRIVWSYDDDDDPSRDPAAAARLAQEGRGVATASGKFVRDLRLGDVVTVWAMARFPGWANHVESVKLDVYFAV